MKYSEMSDTEIKELSAQAYAKYLAGETDINPALNMAGWNSVHGFFEMDWRKIAEVADYCEEPVTRPSSKP